MSNCVTTHTNNDGQARTPADHRSSPEAHRSKTERLPKLLRDEEVISPGRAGDAALAPPFGHHEGGSSPFLFSRFTHCWYLSRKLSLADVRSSSVFR